MLTTMPGTGPPHPETFDAPGFASRLADVRGRVRAVAGGRPVRIVAVTKGFGPEAVDAARAAGLHDLGESYAQELTVKAAATVGGGARSPEGTGSPVRWHFLGAVQRRKVRSLAPIVHLWHGVDREAAGLEIARHAPGAAVLVQVNVTGEPGHNGCGWDEAPALVDRLRSVDLDVRGLMAVGDRDDPRPQFARLARLAAALGLTELSMGMSGDFEAAVEEGSTMVRMGRALFGPRPVPDPGRRRR